MITVCLAVFIIVAFGPIIVVMVPLRGDPRCVGFYYLLAMRNGNYGTPVFPKPEPHSVGTTGETQAGHTQHISSSSQEAVARSARVEIDSLRCCACSSAQSVIEGERY